MSTQSEPSARDLVANADHHVTKAAEARHLRQYDREAHHRIGERTQLKRAEIAALIAIGDALEQIALSR